MTKRSHRSLHTYTSHSAPAEEAMKDLMKHIGTLGRNTGLFSEVVLHVNVATGFQNETASKPAITLLMYRL